ncbi:CPBP family intramembrane glutamic endopeptidase [Lachnospiraceae bacterium 46-15]
MVFWAIKDIFIPLLIHMAVSNAAALSLQGSALDSAAVTAVAAVLSLPFFVLLYRRDRKENPAEESCIPWWVYPLMAAGGAVLNLCLTAAMDYFTVTENFSNTVQEGLLESNFAVQAVGLGILVPIAEEFLFRGLIYQRLKKYVPVWLAILAGAGIFALYHGNMVQIIFAFPMALVMLLAYEKWNSLYVPIIFHMAANLTAVLLNII